MREKRDDHSHQHPYQMCTEQVTLVALVRGAVADVDLPEPVLCGGETGGVGVEAVAVQAGALLGGLLIKQALVRLEWRASFIIDQLVC